MLAYLVRPATRAVRALSSSTSVADITVNITFIQPDGNRSTVPGRVGQTLYDVAAMHGMEMGPTSAGAVAEFEGRESYAGDWTEDLFGEGVTTAWDHVVLTDEWLDRVGTAHTTERAALQSMWGDECSENSRLASQVALTKELDGMAVFVPDTFPW